MSVDRALVLLELLSERGELSITEAAYELGVSPSTVHRTLTTMRLREFVVQDEHRIYRPSSRISIGRASEGTLPALIALAHPQLEWLSRELDCTVHLVILVGSDVRFLDGVESRQPVRFGLRSGTRMPAYATAAGKTMLAQLPRDAINRLYPDGPQPGFGVQITTRAELHAELEEVARRKVAINRAQTTPPLVAFAAALRHRPGAIPAAIALSRPVDDALTSDTDHIVRSLLKAARACDQARSLPPTGISL